MVLSIWSKQRVDVYTFFFFDDSKRPVQVFPRYVKGTYFE